MTTEPLPIVALERCQVTIREKFIHDCVSGNRARILPPGNYAAGQYFDLPDRTQRGLHGTAAALRVVAAESLSGNPARDVARGIVSYLQNRDEIELSLIGPTVRGRELLKDKLRHDRVNTVKQAELLRALSFVPHGLATSDDLKTKVTESLLAGGAKDGRGWAFILGSNQTSHLLPTAHAVRALAANGHSIGHWSAQLARGLVDRCRKRRTDFLAACIDCFILQVMIEIESLSGAEERSVLDHLWRVLRRHMGTPRELNVDFFDGDRQNFVRIPWQLHIVTCSALVRPYRRYLSGEAQHALRAVVYGVLDSDGFRYPESGEHISTRTYAYIYDSLAHILGRRGGRYRPEILVAHGVADAGRPIRMIRKVGRWVLAGGAAIILVVGTVGWLQEDTSHLPELAPNFVSAAVLLILSWLIRARQRG